MKTLLTILGWCGVALAVAVTVIGLLDHWQQRYLARLKDEFERFRREVAE